MRRFGCARIVLAIIIGAAAFLPAPSRADLPKGAIVLAHTAPTAVLIWDASARVGDLVIAQTTGPAGLRALELDGIDILVNRAPQLHASRVELRVQYAATGVVGAAYGASTFANATPLLVMSADRAAIPRSASHWKQAIAADRAPRDLTIRVVGAFP
jgi:hypothetical protein